MQIVSLHSVFSGATCIDLYWADLFATIKSGSDGKASNSTND